MAVDHKNKKVGKAIEKTEKKAKAKAQSEEAAVSSITTHVKEEIRKLKEGQQNEAEA